MQHLDFGQLRWRRNGTSPSTRARGPNLGTAIADRGEPCNCVAENQEAMTGLLESLRSTERVTAQEINIQIAQMMLPCMKPTGNTELDREYSRAMGQCEGFAALTDVMTEVKEEVQARVTQEAEQERATDPDGAVANAVLNKLKDPERRSRLSRSFRLRGRVV